jgi:hypothetical protein
MCVIKLDPQLLFPVVTAASAPVVMGTFPEQGYDARHVGVRYFFLISIQSAIFMIFTTTYIVLHCISVHTVRYFNVGAPLPAPRERPTESFAVVSRCQRLQQSTNRSRWQNRYWQFRLASQSITAIDSLSLAHRRSPRNV